MAKWCPGFANISSMMNQPMMGIYPLEMCIRDRGISFPEFAELSLEAMRGISDILEL